MKKPHFIIDEEGNKLGVLLTIEDYEYLLDKIDDEYSNRLYDRAMEAGEPDIPLEEYLKNRKSVTEERNVALAVYDLYKSLQEEVQADIRKLIFRADQEGRDDLSRMSNQSFSDIWDAPENEHWDQFLKDRLNV
jgi:hypothetical protein